ncbi:flavin reductase [Mycobacterium vulneris]|jgi:hypothetical protein|uniref:Flavin reductase n=1 Tax=Mycolicibacterium vulneris TaxID=547163 RepID=A0A1X2KZ44_9MYCO|nr:flavin reductase [Mycolicibacterium vulneris]
MLKIRRLRLKPGMAPLVLRGSEFRRFEVAVSTKVASGPLGWSDQITGARRLPSEGTSAKTLTTR